MLICEKITASLHAETRLLYTLADRQLTLEIGGGFSLSLSVSHTQTKPDSYLK